MFKSLYITLKTFIDINEQDFLEMTHSEVVDIIEARDKKKHIDMLTLAFYNANLARSEKIVDDYEKILKHINNIEEKDKVDKNTIQRYKNTFLRINKLLPTRMKMKTPGW